MAFAGAAGTDNEHGYFLVDKLAGGKVDNQRPVDGRIKAKGKSITGSKGHYQLREDVSNFGKTSTNGFEPAAGSDAEMTNTFFWDDKS